MPEGKLGKQLTSLLEIAETLNANSEIINTILQATEEQIVNANIGFEIWIPHPNLLNSTTPMPLDDRQGVTYWRSQFGFAKVGSTWHLAAREFRVEQGFPDKEGVPAWEREYLNSDAYPIAQASREDRITALRLLPLLISELKYRAKLANEAIEDAKKLIIC